jgi:hypothetical protein
MLPFAAIGAAAATNVATSVATSIGVGLIDSVTNWSRTGFKASSLADAAKPARVEPVCLIDQVLVDQPFMQDILKLALSNYAGYYLQAVNMICGVGSIDTLGVFDTLNPHRSINGGTTLGNAVRREATKGLRTALGTEKFEHGLPAVEAFEPGYSKDVVAVASLEDSSEKASTDKSQGKDAKKTERLQDAIISDGQKIYEAENLAVGKLLNVELRDGEHKAKIPVLLRLIPVPVPSSVLVHIFSADGRDNWAQRFFMVQTGQLRFWRDFVLGQDMIDAHFKALMDDKSGAYSTMMDRRRDNTAAAMSTGRVSMADASNIAVISTQTLKEAGSKLYGKIEQKAVRDAIFANSYLLLLIVVDERFQRVRIYHRGIDLSTEHRYDEIKAMEKNKGSDIGELFKVFNKAMQTNI